MRVESTAEWRASEGLYSPADLRVRVGIVQPEGDPLLLYLLAISRRFAPIHALLSIEEPSCCSWKLDRRYGVQPANQSGYYSTSAHGCSWFRYFTSRRTDTYYPRIRTM